jgi:replicative DNA helicase
MQEVLDDLYKVSFQKDDIVTLDDLDEFLEEASTAMAKTIPTGIAKLDADLHGGLPRESLITVLAGTNVGKSMFCISLGANALRATDENGNNLDHKVLFVALEGMRSESIMRFASNLSGVEYGRMISDALSDDEKQRMKDMKEKYRDRLMIRNMLDFNVSIEKLMAELSEIYKEFPFTMCIIDYGQLLEHKNKQKVIDLQWLLFIEV